MCGFLFSFQMECLLRGLLNKIHKSCWCVNNNMHSTHVTDMNKSIESTYNRSMETLFVKIFFHWWSMGGNGLEKKQSRRVYDKTNTVAPFEQIRQNDLTLYLILLRILKINQFFYKNIHFRSCIAELMLWFVTIFSNTLIIQL